MLKTCDRIECKIRYSSQRNGLSCPKCQEIENEAFHIIQEFLLENPTASTTEIYHVTKVPLDIIQKLVQSGRFSYVELSRCALCQEALEASCIELRLCENCDRKIQAELKRKLAKRRIHPVEYIEQVLRMQLYAKETVN